MRLVNDQQSNGKTHGRGQWKIERRFWRMSQADAALVQAEANGGKGSVALARDAVGEWMLLRRQA